MRRFVLALLATALTAAPAFAWGKTGHRVVAQIADRYLTDEAAAAVEEILGPEGMAEAADWPDYMRSNPDSFWQSDANPWHYVTIPEGMDYAGTGAPEEGDALTALAHFRTVATDGTAPLPERQLALRFIIHLVGDLHQPLHAGNGTDRGGNLFTCTFFEELTNLHVVWDERLIQYEELSYTEWADWLGSKITVDDVAAWTSASPEDWANESAAIRDTIYPENPFLSWNYVYETRPVLRSQLSKGGVRLGAYLNGMFAPAEPAAE